MFLRKSILSLLFGIILLCKTQFAHAQTGIAINNSGATADISAMLDVASTNKGFLLPRMTTAQRDVINAPATGLVIFNTSVIAMQVNIGTTSVPIWTTLSQSTPGWSLTGNAGTVGGVNFLGTIDAQPLDIRTNNSNRIYITVAGNVGINNIFPSEVLDVAGNIRFSGALMPGNSAGTNGYVLKSNGAGTSPTWVDANTLVTSSSTSWLLNGNAVSAIKTLGTTTNFDLPFITNNTEAMRLTTGNFMGLNNTAPTGRIHSISENSEFGDDYIFDDYTATNTQGFFIRKYRGTAAAPANLMNGDQIAYFRMIGRYNNLAPSGLYNSAGSGIDAYYKGDGTTGATDLRIITSGSEKIRIDENGKMGINNTSPTELLDVTGNIKFSGALMPGNLAGTNGYVLKSNGAGTSPTWVDANTLVTSSGWLLSGNAAAAGSFLGTTNTIPLQFKYNSTIAGFIDGNNNTAFGLNYTVSGTSNTAIGASALAQNSSTAVGASTQATAINNTAIGNNATATGSNQETAIGASATANAQYNTAVGYNARAISNSQAVAIGASATANAIQNVAIGYNAQAVTNGQAIAIGSNALANGQYSTAIGYGANAINNSQTTALGGNSQAGSQYNTAIGYSAQAAVNSQATALGSNSIASGLQSLALGYNTNASATNASAIGYNTTAPNANTMILGDASNASLKVGIGTTSPTEKLDIVGNLKFSGALMPNNLPGTNGYVLKSNGAGTSPTWVDPSTLVSSSSSTGWLVTGNSGLVDNTNNFLGTNDNVAINFRYGNNKAGRIDANNSFFGSFSGYQNNNASTLNTGFGYHTLFTNTTGTRNTAIGYGALQNNTGSDNIGVGYGAETNNTTNSIAIGNNSYITASYGIAIGNAAQTATNTYATAIGVNSYATGGNSVSLGSSAQSAATYSLSLGANSYSSSPYGIAIGQAAQTNSNNYAIAIGANSYSSGIGSIAIGGAALASRAQAQGTNSISLGSNIYTGGTNAIGIGTDVNTAGNTSAIAIGTGAYSGGTNSIALGDHANTTAGNITAIGASTTGNGTNSTALGYASTANGNNSTALGYNANAVNPNTIVIGDAANTSVYTGLGIATPGYKLHVVAPSNPLFLAGVSAGGNTDSLLTILNGVVRKLPSSTFLASSSPAWLLGGNSVASVQTIGTTTNYAFPFITNNTERMRISNTGNVAIGSTSFDPTNPEKLLVDAGTTATVNVISGKGNVDSYLQLNIQNKSAGANASSDVVATANNGDEFNNYIDMGINSSGNSSGFFGNANDAYLYSSGNNFIIGNSTLGQDMIFLTGGGSVSTNEQMRITSSGNVGVGTSIPTNKLTVNASSNPLKLNGVQFGVATTDSMLVINNGVVRKLNPPNFASITKGQYSYIYPFYIANNSGAKLNFTVPGLPYNAVGTNACIVVDPSADLPDGLVIAYTRVTATNTITISLRNTQNSSIAPQVYTFDITIIR